MTLRDPRITPIAFWIAFLALGFVTSFASPPRHASGKSEIVAERETSETTEKSVSE